MGGFRKMNIEKKETQSSFEFGAIGKRMKLYFWDADDLLKKIKNIEKVVKDEKVNDFINEMNIKGDIVK
jgi:hypothetical protein